MPTQAKPTKLTCFHDGDCPLCRLEINAMKKLDKQQQIEWIDINTHQAALEAAGISYQQAMARLYVVDGEQNIQTSVRAFIVLWKRLPYYRYLAVIVEKIPFLLPILEHAYRFFARHRLLLTGRRKAGSGRR